MIAIDLNKQQALDDDPKSIRKINFTTNLDRTRNTRIFFILKEAKKKNCIRLFTRNCKSFVNWLNIRM